MKMSKSLNTAIAVLVLLSTVTATANADSSIKKLSKNRVMTLPIMIGQAMPGGWSSVTINESAVKKAAENAVKIQAEKTRESLELLSIEKAKQQVVAGMNYELRLEISRNGQETAAIVIVWAKLDGSYQVTEWWWKG
jgi:hypothetical protein